MFNFKRLPVLAAFFAFASSADPYSIAPVLGDLVRNGGFENGLNDWTTGDPPPDALVSAPQAFSGVGCLSFYTKSGAPATISQTIATSASTTYIINFHLFSADSSQNSFECKLNGEKLFSITNDVEHDYQLHTFAFTTPSSGNMATVNTIQFDGGNEPSFFIFDDVSIVVLPVPCSSDFYAFDVNTGHLKIESGKKYPGPPQPDSSFPAIDNGQLLFNFKSDAISHTLPRAIALGLAPSGGKFSDTQTTCQWQKPQASNCPAGTSADISFAFSSDSSDPNVFSESVETLFLKNCVTRTVSADSATITIVGDVFTRYTDAYDLGNQWSEVKPISFSMVVPYSAQALATSAAIDVVSDEVVVSYLPVQVINDGTGANPIVQFTTIATTFYPFVAYGAGTKYLDTTGSPITLTDTSGNGVCILYDSPGQVATDTSYCDSNHGICTVECTRVIPIRAPECDLSNYDWEFSFSEYQDFSPGGAATTVVTDPTWALFTEDLFFDSSPQWDVCPSVNSPDYSSFISSSAIHGRFDGITSNPLYESSNAVLATAPLTFGFKIYIDFTRPDSNGVSASSTHIYKATLTEMKVTGPHGDVYLVGSSSGPTVGGAGTGQAYVHGLTFDPPITGQTYPMFISPQTTPTDPKFALSTVTFVPNLGDSSGPNNMLYNSDSSPVTLTITFAGVISLFADGSTPSKRDIVFRRQITASPNGTFADPSQVVNSLSKENFTTIIIEIPKGVNVATIVGVIIGVLVGLCLLIVSVFLYRRKRTQKENAIPVSLSEENLEFYAY